MSDFETRVLPVVTKLARKFFGRNEQLVQDAIGVCWYRYQQAERRLEVTATAFAQVAVKQVRAGRNIPPVTTRDAMDRGVWQAAGLEGLADKKPGPERIAEGKETVKVLMERAKDRPTLRRFLKLAMDGENNSGKLARLLGISSARVSQLRREAAGLVWG